MCKAVQIFEDVPHPQSDVALQLRWSSADATGIIGQVRRGQGKIRALGLEVLVKRVTLHVAPHGAKGATKSIFCHFFLVGFGGFSEGDG